MYDQFHQIIQKCQHFRFLLKCGYQHRNIDDNFDHIFSLILTFLMLDYTAKIFTIHQFYLFCVFIDP